MPETIRTSSVTDRRRLSFANLGEVLDDVARLDAARSRRTTGNWSDAEIVAHLAIPIEFCVDGFPPARPPLWIRAAARMLRGMVLRRRMKPGLRLPAEMSFLLADPATTWPQAVDRLRRAVARFGSSTRVVPSPVLGPMSHDDWTSLHCRHAELHLAFVHPETLSR